MAAGRRSSRRVAPPNPPGLAEATGRGGKGEPAATERGRGAPGVMGRGRGRSADGLTGADAGADGAARGGSTSRGVSVMAAAGGLSAADAAVAAARSASSRPRRSSAARSSAAAYVELARVENARIALDSGDLPVEAVARRAGFGTVETMRRAFRRRVGVSPADYRGRFRSEAA